MIPNDTEDTDMVYNESTERPMDFVEV